MKILTVGLLLMASLEFVLVGCTDKSSPVVSSTEQVMNPATAPAGLAKAGRKVVHSLNGSAHAYNLFLIEEGAIVPGPKQKGGFYNVQSIQADEYSDGSVSGKILYQFLGKLSPELAVGLANKMEGKVIHFKVEGKKAFVVVEITKWVDFPDPAPPLPWWFAQAYIDNGEGALTSDEASEWWMSPLIADRDFWVGMGPQEFIDWQTPILLPTGWPVVYPIDHGNIQVH
jgi:hypothetical protein